MNNAFNDGMIEIIASSKPIMEKKFITFSEKQAQKLLQTMLSVEREDIPAL